MGRYSSVKAFTDDNANMRSVSYEQAVSSSSSSSNNNNSNNNNNNSGVVGISSGGSAVRPEKVNNPYGSTAGAGSGDFHVYRHARAREQQRWKELNQTEQERILNQEFHQKVAQDRMEEEQKTAQRRKKRQRQKEAKKRKRNLLLSNVQTTKGDDDDNVDDNEFRYIPNAIESESPNKKQRQDKDDDANGGDDKGNDDDQKQEVKNAPKRCGASFPNDGSFLQRMKETMAEGKLG